MGPVMFGLITSLIGIGYVLYLTRTVLRINPGSNKLREISAAIQEGAAVFMKRELKTLAIFTAVVAPVLLLALRDHKVVIAFVAGVVVSAVVGYLSMVIATKANARIANAAISSFPAALKGAFSGGAVMGFGVVGFGLLGLTALYFFFSEHPEVLLGYAFGASSVALFLRVGGGIFTKSADVGADLVGKIEKSIPEDDPRNPATIADNVGDNVGDIAGMGSDLFESYVSAVIAAVFLGALLSDDALIALPMFLAGTGILAAMVGSFFVKPGKAKAGFEEQTKSAKNALNKGIYVATGLMAVAGYFVISEVVGNDAKYKAIHIFIAMLTGLASGLLIGKITEFFTSGWMVKELAKASSTPGTNIISGLSSGMLSTVPPVIVVVTATLVAYHFAGLYGIAIAAIGMLVTLGMVLAVDGYGPIVDNAAGIAEMAGLGQEVRARAEALDAVGNTTAAIGKGFAISSAALAALAWIAAFFAEANVRLTALEKPELIVSLMDPKVMTGLFIGGMLPFLFSALTMKSVSAGALKVVNEVRRQFSQISGLMEGRTKPDYGRCVDIVTKASIREMLMPGIIVLATPLIVGYFLGVAALGGMLAGSLVTGFMLAVMMANSGGAWDNAKKYVEAGNLGGKGSEYHKATVIGDTVGDPFKDTSGPSLNILIKVVGKVALIFIPVFIFAS